MRELLVSCEICPRRCRVNRFEQVGFCGGGAVATVNLWQKHMGEEPVISGTRGSGTIFFSRCNLRCVYCQNYRISHFGWGREYEIAKLAEIMLALEADGAHNINLVSPTHYTPQIRAAIIQARASGLQLPVLWNSNGYESPQVLRTLEGLVDIYLPDLRYISSEPGQRYSHCPDYHLHAPGAILEMARQVGKLRMNEEGVAERGLLCRVLVLPSNANRAGEILAWIADHLGVSTYVSLLAQYYPTHKAADYPEIARPLAEAEYSRVLALLDELHLENGFVQELGITPEWTPAFVKAR